MLLLDIADCLQIWGTGLFQGQVSIDQALNPESKSGAKTLLKKNVAGIIADISILLRESSSISSYFQVRSRLQSHFAMYEGASSIVPCSHIYNAAWKSFAILSAFFQFSVLPLCRWATTSHPVRRYSLNKINGVIDAW